ncbi:hypothetical protein N7466_009042 [Penicillium verhagenii]|uniref:uncharacterized protein n=1 Tax=Penicillium verhagenii TaxID=1562060 RepID=UPI0025455DAF|nr:uncharacterized protein N7466_009042 [Penicillium verhagenii]KAJ5924855.1 hypothetical protein N7466_009042 [Penicillium verhagenii]
MFYNFAAPRSIAKRQRVNRACNFCRAQRIRCDPHIPCAQCVDHDVSCSRLRSLHSSPNRRESRKNASDFSQPQRVPETASNSSQSGPGTTPRCPPSPHSPDSQAVSITYQLDSTLEFVTRINTFCSGVLRPPSQIGAHLSNDNNDEHPGPYRSPFCPGEVDPISAAYCDISPEQMKSLFWVFRTRLHPHIPILSQEDLEMPVSPAQVDDDNEPLLPTPLQDAVIAYTMQYIFHSGLHTRLLGLQWKHFEPGNRSRVIGMQYFQRCLAYCTQYAIFATPSLMTLKCFCIMSLFLLDTGQHHAAYSLIGMAVRVARFLNLDRVEPGSDEMENLQLWWTLVHLDFRCSRYSGKPVSEIFSIAASTPFCPPDSVANGKSSPYYFQCLRLTCAALAVVKALTHRLGSVESDIEAHALVLSGQLLPIEKWKEDLRSDRYFRHIHVRLDLPDLHPHEEENYNTLRCEENHSTTNPISHPLQIQLSTLLELQYHDILISLHRSFIILPPSTPPHAHRPETDSHAHTALNHALRTIDLIHTRMTQHDVFYGCSELYQYQWNAVLTIIGFMLAYSSSIHCAAALRHIDLALQVFEFGGRLSDAAARAAEFTRFLRDKVYKMGISLDINSGDSMKEMQSSGDLSAFGIPMEGDVYFDRTRGTSILPHLTTDLSLWSWADFVDPNVVGL